MKGNVIPLQIMLASLCWNFLFIHLFIHFSDERWQRASFFPSFLPLSFLHASKKIPVCKTLLGENIFLNKGTLFTYHHSQEHQWWTFFFRFSFSLSCLHYCTEKTLTGERKIPNIDVWKPCSSKLLIKIMFCSLN